MDDPFDVPAASAEWPDLESWMKNPQALLDDLQILLRNFERLWSRDDLLRVSWFNEANEVIFLDYATQFEDRLQAYAALRPCPISAASLKMVGECVARNAGSEKIDNTYFEACRILHSACRVVEEFIRILPSRKKPKNTGQNHTTDITPEQRNAIFRLLDTMAKNPLTQNPTRKELRLEMNRKALRIGNEIIKVVMSEWRSQKSK